MSACHGGHHFSSFFGEEPGGLKMRSSARGKHIFDECETPQGFFLLALVCCRDVSFRGLPVLKWGGGVSGTVSLLFCQCTGTRFPSQWLAKTPPLRQRYNTARQNLRLEVTTCFFRGVQKSGTGRDGGGHFGTSAEHAQPKRTEGLRSGRTNW